MPVRITNQAESADLVRQINLTHGALQRTMERLSSGWRINRASDDPAGLVVSEKLRARIASLNQEIENTTLAIQKYETADSTINQLRATIRDLRVMASAVLDGGSDDASRAVLQAAAEASVRGYNRIIETAEYNHAPLLDGSEGALADLTTLGGIDLSSAASAEQALALLDEATGQLDMAQVDIGATQENELEVRRSTLEVTAANLTASESAIRDADVPAEMAAMVRQEIMLQSGLALLAHANVNPRVLLSAIFGD